MDEAAIHSGAGIPFDEESMGAGSAGRAGWMRSVLTSWTMAPFRWAEFRPERGGETR